MSRAHSGALPACVGAMKTPAMPYRRWGLVLFACCNSDAYVVQSENRSLRSTSFGPRIGAVPLPAPSTSFFEENCNSGRRRRRPFSLEISTVDVELDCDDVSRPSNRNSSSSDNLLSWKDALPLSIYTTICLAGALMVSTYEDYDVTHTRPSPSTLRLPTSPDRMGKQLDFLGASTRGMGWGPSNRGMGTDANNKFFEEWYGSSAMTLQFKPSYNEIMKQHRSERVPRWNALEDGDNEQAAAFEWAGTKKASSTKTNAIASKEQQQQAVLQLYQSLDELDDLKAMADDYRWDDIKERLNPTTNALNAESPDRYPLPMVLEYSMDVLKTAPGANGELPALVGFDWGSCAWRHCGAKADAQEAMAELYGSVGMLEPFECRFIIDVVERSIRDVLAVVPDDLKPMKDGVVIPLKPYEPYVSQAGNDDEGMGIDYEYSQALSELRVDLTSVE